MEAGTRPPWWGIGSRMVRILGIVDIYSALTKTRAYRPAIQGPHAVRALLESRGSSVDPVLAQELIRILGLWPPGLLAVRLVSGETAVVVRRTANLKAPEIRVIADSDGRQLLIYQFRDASEPDSLIQEVLPRNSDLPGTDFHRIDDPQQLSDHYHLHPYISHLQTEDVYH